MAERLRADLVGPGGDLPVKYSGGVLSSNPIGASGWTVGADKPRF